MTNKRLIEKILNKIHYKNHKLKEPMLIDGELLKEIIFYSNELPNGYGWCLAHDTWEVSLNELTNRELIKLYQSL